MINELAKKLVDAIKQVDKSSTTGYDTAATVKRVEGDTAWVHIDGGVDETPVKMTISASEGDKVQVRVNGGRAWLQGNATAPPTDDTTANVARTIATDAQEEAIRAGKAADAAEAEAVRAGAAADRAEESASDALTAAQSAQTSADSALVSLATVEDVAGVLEWITNHGTMTLTSDVTVNPSHVYFVVDAGGDYVVGSTHYSIVSEPKDSELSTYYELSVDKSIQNYVATHVVVDSEGLWLIPDSNGSPTSNGKKILIATGNGSTYTDAGTYIIDRSSGTDHVYAKFLANGATMTAGDGTQLANLGYGTAIDEHGYTGTFPYYTLGKRQANTQVGAFSMAEGKETEAVAFASHAEGFATTVTSAGENGHAEGNNTTVSGIAGHAEGQETTASGDFSHAEGFETTASGTQAHAGGYYTEAAYANQFVIGKYNDNKSGDLFEIGNGAANARKNVFEVDSSGNVNIASGAKYKINGAVCVSPEVINHYGICTSAAGSQKTVTVTPAITELTAGLTIQVYFNATNTISNPTLDVNGTGAKRIAGSGSSYIGTTPGTSWPTGTLVTLTYDGDYWVVNNYKKTVTGVKGSAELSYGTGDVTISAANVGAVALSDKYTRSSAGDLAWTGQTDGDAKVIAKSALAFWNGAYSGNGSNLSKCSTGNIIGSNGGTMTGQLLTSFNSSVAMGSYGTAQTTLDGFVGEVRYSSGCMGSVSINTAYTKNGTTIPTGWYNFIYSPHRSGGNSGAASGDNCNYGTLILSGMTMSAGPYFIQVNGGSIQSVKLISSTGGWVLAGSAKGTNTVTISDSNASEVYVKVNPTGTSVYSATILRSDLQSIWYVGGYYYSSTDYGIVNINVSNSNKTFQLRNVRNGGSDVKSSSKLTVYYR